MYKTSNVEALINRIGINSVGHNPDVLRAEIERGIEAGEVIEWRGGNRVRYEGGSTITLLPKEGAERQVQASNEQLDDVLGWRALVAARAA